MCTRANWPRSCAAFTMCFRSMSTAVASVVLGVRGSAAPSAVFAGDASPIVMRRGCGVRVAVCADRPPPPPSLRRNTQCCDAGFRCKLCKSNEVIYPFDVAAVAQCPKCFAAYHRVCWMRSKEWCPLCDQRAKRLEQRRAGTTEDAASASSGADAASSASSAPAGAV